MFTGREDANTDFVCWVVEMNYRNTPFWWPSPRKRPVILHLNIPGEIRRLGMRGRSMSRRNKHTPGALAPSKIDQSGCFTAFVWTRFKMRYRFWDSNSHCPKRKIIGNILINSEFRCFLHVRGNIFGCRWLGCTGGISCRSTASVTYGEVEMHDSMSRNH